VIYTKVHVDWKNEVEGLTTPILAEDLEQIEEGIAQASRSASETQDGNVELATQAEMNAGSDSSKVPPVSKVATYVSAQIAAAIAALPGVSPASETASGVVELATQAEMNAGSDTPLRVPSVLKVATYVAAQIATAVATINTALNNKADKAGLISQFSDVSDSAPIDQGVLRYNGGVSSYTPFNLDGLYAPIGADGRIVASAYPFGFTPLKVINEGDSTQDGWPAGTVYLSRPPAGSMVPQEIGQGANTAGGLLSVSATTTTDLAVDDYLVFAIATSGEDTAPTAGGMPQAITFAETGSGVMAARTLARGSYRSGTIQADLYFAKITTAMPTGSVITASWADTRSNAMLTLIKCTGLAGTNVEDLSAEADANYGNSTVTLSRSIATAAATTAPNALGLMIVGFNPGVVGTDDRSVAGTNGWSAVGPVNISDNGSARRAMSVFYQTYTTTGIKTGSIQITAADAPPSSGSYSLAIITLKAA
jgi:hypothetical protein